MPQRWQQSRLQGSIQGGGWQALSPDALSAFSKDDPGVGVRNREVRACVLFIFVSGGTWSFLVVGLFFFWFGLCEMLGMQVREGAGAERGGFVCVNV